MEGNIAATYALIYRFLKQQLQHKAAEAVKKAAKGVVVLRDDIKQEGPPLEDIIKEWKTKGNTKSDVESPSEDSGSSDGSSSGSEDGSSTSTDSSSEDTSGSESGDDTSDGDDSSDDSDGATVAKKLPQKAAERDTSATLSSVGENAQGVAKQVVAQILQKSTKDMDKATKNKNKGTKSDSSLQHPASDSSDAESSSSSSGFSGSSDSSDEDEANVKAAPKVIGDKSPSTSESSSASEDESESESQRTEDIHVTKKRKTSQNGAAMTTAVATGSQQVAQEKEKPPPKARDRFQRVKVQNLELLLNNGYEARGGALNDYGERAHRDLVVTRGAGFRKEKNKKKRGSYRGGEITMESRSIKFEF